MRSALTAASRLRAEVLKMEGLILIVDPGRPDKVIQVTPWPDYISDLRTEQRKSTRDEKLIHVELNLSRNPEQEAFKMLEREINLRSPRDRAVPVPLAVAENLRDEWSVMPEDVPVADISGIQLPAERPLRLTLRELAAKQDQEDSEYACSECEKTFPKKNALQLHTRNKHAAKARLEAKEAKVEAKE